MKIFLVDKKAEEKGEVIGEWVELPISDEEYCIIKSEILSEGEFVTGESDHDEIVIYEADDENYPFSAKDLEFDELNDLIERLDNLNERELSVFEYMVVYEGEELEEAYTVAKETTIYVGDLEEVAEELYEEGFFGENCLDPKYVRFGVFAEELSVSGWVHHRGISFQVI